MITISQVVPTMMEAVSNNEAFAAFAHEIANSFISRAVSKCISSIRGLS
jgi:hypothetical protein